jgi:hypothetical protein
MNIFLLNAEGGLFLGSIPNNTNPYQYRLWKTPANLSNLGQGQ